MAAAARWLRLRDNHGPSMQADAGAALPGTARIARSGTILVGSSMLQWFDLEDERRLIGILSAAAALANISPVALERALEREFDPSPVVRLHQQSEWKLVSGVEIDSFVAHCSRLARSLWQGPAPRGQARVQAVAAAEMLLTFVGTGLAKRVDDSQAGLC